MKIIQLKMSDQDKIVKDFKVLAEDLKDKYEIKINKISLPLNSHNLKNMDIINKIYEASFHFF